MPYSDKFKKIMNHFDRMYDDDAKARELAYKEAFQIGIKTYRDRVNKFKKQSLSISDMGF